MKRLTDPAFKYVPAARTNIAATFKRIRKEMQEQARVTNVQPITQRKGN